MNRARVMLCAAAISLAGARADAQNPESPAPGTPPERMEALPQRVATVGIDEKLGETLPLDLTFVDENGRRVTLGEYFRAGRPVVLNLGYFGCPMLCGLVSRGLVNGLRDVPLEVGEDFVVLSVSIDPSEGPELAQGKKESTRDAYGRPGADRGWSFLTGGPSQIEKLTSAVGFRYAWVESRQEFAHAAALVVLTPQGRISRYLYGVEFPADTVRLSLVEASDGGIGSPVDQLILLCFQYDAEAGRYALVARNLMRLAAAITVAALTAAIAFLLGREFRARKSVGVQGKDRSRHDTV